LGKRNRTVVTAALLLAGSVLFCGGATGRVKENVLIDGIPVGGMRYEAAVSRVRAAREEIPLVIVTPQGRFPAEGITTTDNLRTLVRHARRGERLQSHYKREWADMERRLEEICSRCARAGKNAEVTFSDGSFSYTEGERSVACDYAGLLESALQALRTDRREIVLICQDVAPEVDTDELKRRTQPLSVFSTAFSAANSARCGNIALACRRIDGTIIAAGEEFSFNAAVGERTAGNGFLPAPVILNGRYVQGIGGGVCQVSTTLFGAALRAGMRVTESHPHSLAVSYAPPSLDAMVSSCSDFRFRNETAFPVYLSVRAADGRIECRLYGCGGESHYEVESCILSRISPPAPVVEEGEDGILREEREGTVSESYLLKYDGDRLTERKLIRRDVYAPVQGIFRQKHKKTDEKQEEIENLPQNCLLFLR